METKDNDRWRDLFSAMPDDTLPLNFQAKVMHAIREKAVLREKRRRFWEICGYASGIAAMLIVCAITFYYFDISFNLPKIELSAWSFPKPDTWSFPKLDFEVFGSPSFGFSLPFGISAMFLLIADSLIRRHIERTKHKQSNDVTP